MSPKMALRRIAQVSSIPTRGEDGRHGDVLAFQELQNIALRAPQRKDRRGASHSQERLSYQRRLFAGPEASKSRRQYSDHNLLMRKGLLRERRGSRISEANEHRPSLRPLRAKCSRSATASRQPDTRSMIPYSEPSTLFS